MTSKAADALDALAGPETDPADSGAVAAAQTTGPARNPGGRPRKDGTPAQPTTSPDYVPPATGARPDKARKHSKAPPSAPAKVRAPTISEEAAAEAAKAARRFFFAQHEEQIKKALGGFYGFPFEVAAAATSLPKIELDAARKAERAETMYWVLCVYCPDWTKHLPLLILGGAVCADAAAAFAVWKAAKDEKKGTTKTAPRSPDVMAGVLVPAISPPPDTPPVTTARGETPDAA